MEKKEDSDHLIVLYLIEIYIRKRKPITFEDKFKIIELLKQGKSISQLSRELHISKSTISRINQHTNELLYFIESIDKSEGLSRKKMRKMNHEAIDRKLFNWYLGEQEKLKIVTGAMISRQVQCLLNVGCYIS